jgi:peptidoglycan/LPS O-acetylase OafA/YrhL
MAGSRVAEAFSLRRNLRLLFVPRPDEVPAVTGARALGMIWVLVQHTLQGLRPLGSTPAGARWLAHPILSFGWAGNLAIESFFVISGYLIGGMLIQEREVTGSLDLRSFYVRRALRILPAYAFAMMVYLATDSVNKDQVWANLVFVNNFLPFQKQFMAHCWSLAIEEQFYAVLPVCMLLLYRLKPSLRTPIIGLSVVAAFVIALFVVLGQDVELSVRFPTSGRFWHYMDAFYTKPQTRYGTLAMGIFVAELEREGRVLRWLEARPMLPVVLSALSLAVMIAVIRIFPECRGPSGQRLPWGQVKLAFDGYLYGIGAAYVLLVSRTNHWSGKLVCRALGNRPLHVLAQLSFSIYLLHPVCITPLFPWLGFDLAHPWLSYLKILGSGLVVSTAAAMVVYLFIELPIMHLRPRRRVAAVTEIPTSTSLAA